MFFGKISNILYNISTAIMADSLIQLFLSIVEGSIGIEIMCST